MGFAAGHQHDSCRLQDVDNTPNLARAKVAFTFYHDDLIRQRSGGVAGRVVCLFASHPPGHENAGCTKKIAGQKRPSVVSESDDSVPLDESACVWFLFWPENVPCQQAASE